MYRRFEGVFPILVTPFDNTGRIDGKSIDSMVEYEVRVGANGIAVLGIMGEAHKLLDVERERTVRRFVKADNGRIPVIVGSGHAATEVAMEYSRNAQSLGADGVLLAPPKLAKPSDNALLDYFKSVSEVIDIPIFVQDEPTFTGVNMSVSLIAELSKIKHVEYVKLEDAPTPPKITQIRKLVRDRIGVFGGLGGVFCLEELFRGASGIMTGFAYPEILIEIYKRYKSGDDHGAAELFYKYLPIIRYEFQPAIGLAIRKRILRMRGIIRNDYARKPALSLDKETIEELDYILEKLKLPKNMSNPLL